MLKLSKWFVWGVALLAIIPASLAAQSSGSPSFVYTNNDLSSTSTPATSTIGNSVSAFQVVTGGSLSLIGTYSTGGQGTNGGLYAANRIIVVGDFLYASNAGSNDVSAFAIDPTYGTLTQVGSPYSIGPFFTTNPSGISLAATPDGQYLYAGSTYGYITVFGIQSNGALNQLSTTNTLAPMSSLKVTPDGKYLLVALYQTNQVGVFAIQSSDGSLVQAGNSPFTLTNSNNFDYGTGIDVNCASNQVFVGRTGADIDVLSLDSTGTLNELANSPFYTGSGTSNGVVVLNRDDSTLFSSDQANDTVSAFAVGSNGSLTFPGYTVSAETNSGANAGGLATSQDGSYLYAANSNYLISPFGIGGSNALSPLSPFTITASSFTSSPPQANLRSLAAFPAKACSSSSSSGLTASLQITAGPPPGFNLLATLTLDRSLTIDPSAQGVTMDIGTFSIDLAAGSLTLHQGGTNSGTYVFQGNINGVNLKLQISPLGNNQFLFSAYGKQVDLTGLANPVTVTLGIGGNSASTSVTAIMTSTLSNSTFVQSH